MNRKLITVSESDHISFNIEDESLCGEVVTECQVIQDYVDVTERDGICQNCVSKYVDWRDNGGRREPTIKCECDIRSNEELEKCETVTSAYKARELNHPDADSPVPICKSCYNWIQSLDSNNVSTKYENAKPWLQKSKPSSIPRQ